LLLYLDSLAKILVSTLSFTGLKFRYGLVVLAGKYRQFIDDDALIADCQRIGACLGEFYFARWGHGSGNVFKC
jgi:hypothetical protein